MQTAASVTSPVRVRKIVRLGVARAEDQARAQALSPLEARHIKQNENRALVERFRVKSAVGRGATAYSAPVSPNRGMRLPPPGVARPKVERLGRSHLNSLIVLMVLLWAGVLALGINKGLTPPSGMFITSDK